MSRIRRHAVVVGAGIFGVATTRELLGRGWRVTLVDPGPIPRPTAASTDRSKVVRMDYGRDRHLSELAEAALEGWRRWDRDLFERPLFHEVGFLLLTRDPMVEGGFEYESFRTLTAMGHPLERVDPAELAPRFPAWNPAVYRDGYVNPHAGWVESGEAVQRLADLARAEGAELRAQRVDGLLESDEGVAGVRVAGTELLADAVVVAAGAWTPTLVPELGSLLTPTAMPVLHFRPADPGRFRGPAFPVWGADISRTGWYGFPAGADGVLKMGHHGRGWPADPESPGGVPTAWEDRARAFFSESLSGLARAEFVGARACLYCDSPDGQFWIGADPERPGLVIAAGGSGHGFKFGPVLGGWVADALEGAGNPASARFAWRTEAPVAREDARFDGA